MHPPSDVCPALHRPALPEYPFAPGLEGTPPPEYDRLRREEPVCLVQQPSGEPAWLVTRAGDIMSVLSDRRFSRNFALHDGAMQGARFDYDADADNLFNMDPPEHTRVRRTMNTGFSVRGVSHWKELIDRVVEDVLDRIAVQAQPVDLWSSFVQELSQRVMAELFGFSESERRIMSAAALGQLSEDGDYEELGVFDRMTSAISMAEELIVKVMSSPERVAASPLLALLAAHSGGDAPVSQTEILEACKLVTFANVDTLSHVLGCGLVQMFKHEDQLAACIEDPGLWPNAVDEMLRYTMAFPTQLARVALEDVELSGVTIRRGESVIAHATAVGWDRDLYPDPEVFDIAREPRGSLVFGQGPHRCLGAPLARMQLMTAFTSLFARFPDLRLAIAASEITWTLGVQSISPAALPVVFTGAHPQGSR